MAAILIKIKHHSGGGGLGDADVSAYKSLRGQSCEMYLCVNPYRLQPFLFTSCSFFPLHRAV